MSVRTKAVVKLSPELERALLAGVLGGVVEKDLADPDELSTQGRLVYRAAVRLYAEGVVPPLPLESVLIVLTDFFGANRESARAYLESLYASADAANGAKAALTGVREKHALLAVANAVTDQLQRNVFDAAKLVEVLQQHAAVRAPQPLSEILADGLPPPPPYIQLPSLPHFTTRVGGLIGLVALAGETGIGKSTFCWQVALDAAQDLPVAYYDLENGLATMVHRTATIFGKDLEKIKAAVRQLYYRDNARTLEADLMSIRPPALVIVDQIQKLPTSLEFRKQGLDRWVHRLEGLKRHGYYILLVSEIPRSQYGQGPFVGAFKETGEIEFSADVALQMIPTNDGAELHVTKNRHGQFKGLVATMRRERGFLWREVG